MIAHLRAASVTVFGRGAQIISSADPNFAAFVILQDQYNLLRLDSLP